MIKLKIINISKINDFVILNLPNGDYAPMETTTPLSIGDVILLSNSLCLGYNTFYYGNDYHDGFIEDFCSLEIAMSYLY